MRIQNNTQAYKNKNQNVSHKSARTFVRTLANPDALTSTVLLEGAVTGGRGYNAYKRGGVNEFRERFIDDVLAAIFWMKGVDIFNSIGNKFGEKVLKLPTTDFDMGNDALRKPFENVAKDLTKMGVAPENASKMKKTLARFKLGKIIAASVLSTAFVGFALPKINQGITKFFMSKDKKEETKKTKNNSTNLGFVSMDDFEKNLSKKKGLSFKGGMELVAHYLENNKICKLLTSDVGITTGRVTSARNKDEGLEYLFRDVASSFFYTASTPLIYAGLQKATNSSSITSIDPVAAKQVNEHLLKQLEQAGGKMKASDFARTTMGVLDDASKELLEKLPFVDDVIPVKELIKHIEDKELIKKAARMSRLQPNQAGVGGVLTKQQVTDVLKNGSINTPEFMKSVYTEHFGEKLTDKYRFIPMKKITKFRDNIDDYISSVVKTAEKKNGGIVTKDILEKVNKKGFAMSAGFRTIAIGVSALALGVAIPKVQYAITKMRTGSSAAPGLREYEQKEEKKA
ncbi:MAG: hypothetical protein IJY61_07895 [Candidatus Gastranaerophilales bacterium]|nr:hypothetical protein [Candidatus Gastranaerophilales bacterium]